MADIYDVLIGEAPTDAEKAAEVAAALRRRRSFGELGMLTGDKILSPMGKNLVGRADQYAENIQRNRQMDTDNAQTRRYQEGQLGHMGSVLKESLRYHDMSDATTRRGQDLAYLAALARAENSSKPPKLTVSDRRDLTEGAGLVGNLRGLITDFKDSYAAPQIRGQSIPAARPLSNAIAASGIGTDNMINAQQWWAASDRLYNLFQRNKLFGATLTTNEMKAWAQANASQNMRPDQIKAMLGSILTKADAELKANVEGFKTGGYNADQVDAFTQRATDPNPSAMEGMDPAAAPDTGDFGDLSAEEIEELKQLEKELGGR